MSETAVGPALVAELEKIQDPGQLLGEIFRRFGARAAIGTSGQLTGTALIDLACAQGVKPRVFTNDTLRLFPETLEFFQALEKHYKLTVERFTPDPVVMNKMVQEQGEYLFFDSKAKQEYCCHVRKVEPNERAIASLDVWITGLRKDQSQARSKLQRFEIQKRADRPLLKVAPLLDWTEQHTRDYLKSRKAPLHKLLEWEGPGGWRYESLGCILCTTPIGPNEPRRAGRWRWFNDSADSKECGIHLPQDPKGQ